MNFANAIQERLLICKNPSKTFQQMNIDAKTRCIESEESFVYLGQQLIRYNLRDPEDETCKYMAMSELEFLAEIRSGQQSRAETILEARPSSE